jgi:CHAD domain-containing protein
MDTIREVEWKFEPDGDDTTIPDLGEIGMRLGPADELDLRATYFDTPDLRLLAHRITLRHRTGGNDAGWHLKLPADGDARTEVHAPAGAGDEIPAELRELVRARVRDQPLQPRASIATRRIEQAVLRADGTAVALLADDHVCAERFADGAASEWHELEVELTADAPNDVLDHVAGMLQHAGWRRSTSASKAGKVLGVPPAAPDPPRRTAERCLIEHLATQVEAIVAADPLIRRGDGEAVHAMRVATRRLRSALATFRPVVDPTRTEPLRARVRELGAVLGAARDDQVLRARLIAEVEALPVELVLGPVADRIRREMHDREEHHHARLVEALDSPDHLRLLDELDALVNDPPWSSERAADRTELRRRVAHAARRVDRLADRAAAATGSEREAALHELRKAAKRARYAAEMVQPLFGKPAKRSAARFEALQEVLGEQQDSVAARAVLRQLGASVRTKSENGFTFGLLHQVEADRGRVAQRRAGRVYERTTGGRSWLRH